MYMSFSFFLVFFLYVLFCSVPVMFLYLILLKLGGCYTADLLPTKLTGVVVRSC